MREKRLFSQDGTYSLPFEHTELIAREDENGAKIIAKCGPEEYCMWEGDIEDAKKEVKYASEYLLLFWAFSYRLGTMVEKRAKKKKE